MDVVSTILGGRFVRKNFVVGHVILADAIDTVGHTYHQWSAQVAEEGADGNVHDVIAETAPIWLGPPPARRHGPVERSTLITSGIKIPAMSVRLLSMAGPLPPKTNRLISRASSGFSAYLRKSVLS